MTRSRGPWGRRPPRTGDAPKRPAAGRRISRYWVLLILLTVFLRLPAILHPMSIDDEGGYAVVAHEWLQGGTLYQSALDRRPPLLFWTYAAIFRTVGPYNWYGFHLVATAWILVTMWGLYAIATHWFSRPAGLAAALLYSICTTRSDWVNLALNGEVMTILPVVWAYFLIFKRRPCGPVRDLGAAGILLACAFLIKQPAAVAAIPAGVYLLLPSYRSRHGMTLGRSIWQAFVLTASYFAVLGCVALILHHQGILHDAFYWTVLDHDLPHGPTDFVFWYRAVKETLATAAAWHPLLILCFVSLRESRRKGARYWQNLRPEWVALLVSLGVSGIAVCASGRFYSHYYFQFLPALVLLAAPVLADIWSGARTDRLLLLRPFAMKFMLGGTALAFLVLNTVQMWPLRTPNPLTRYVRAHTGPQDKVFFWGQNDWMYAEAKRRPASRFILSFPLTGYIFGSPLSDDPDYDTSYRILPGAWDTLQKEFDQHPPVLFIDTDPGSIAKKYPPSRYPFLRRLLHDQYRKVFTDPTGIIYRRIDPTSSDARLNRAP